MQPKFLVRARVNTGRGSRNVWLVSKSLGRLVVRRYQSSFATPLSWPIRLRLRWSGGDMLSGVPPPGRKHSKRVDPALAKAALTVSRSDAQR